MLTYLINVTNDMLAFSLLIGMMMAFLDTYCKNSGKIIARIGLGVGIIIAGLRAYFTNTRRIKNGWMIGTYGYGFTLGFLVLTIIAVAVFGYFLMKNRIIQNENSSKLGAFLTCFALCLQQQLCTPLFRMCLTYPFKFDTGGETAYLLL